MPIRTAPAWETDALVGMAELQFADGRPVPVRTLTVAETTKDEWGKPRTRKRHVYDLKGESRCERCGGQPEDDGTVKADMGRICFWMPDGNGRWLSYVGACGGPSGPPYTGCIYGVLIHARGERWVEDYNVPQGLNQIQWAVLHEAAQRENTYAEAAERLRRGELPGLTAPKKGSLTEEIADMLPKISAWASQ